MDYPDDIAELEHELQRVTRIVERDGDLVARSKRPKVESVFLASSIKLRENVQERLRVAYARRAHEFAHERHAATVRHPLTNRRRTSR